MTVNKKGTPYFNDYDASKRYQEVLFKAGLGLQCRELNELQSMQLRQIKLIGDGIYKDGTVVIPGGTAYETNVDVISVQFEKGSVPTQSGVVFTGETYGVVAKSSSFVSRETNTYTFFIEYISSGTTGQNKTFFVGEAVTVNVNGVDVTGTVTDITAGSRFSVKSGVYYAGGRFLESNDQTITLDIDSVTPSYCVGFDVDETVVSVNEDPTLYDNANGYPNHAAPGADRLKVTLKLTKYPLSRLSTLPETFIELFRVNGGDVVKDVKNTQYSTLADTLARRTYDQSGNYTVNPFHVQIHENDDTSFIVSIGAGKAYVKGYEVENITTKHIVVDKARQSENFNNAALSPKLGSYVDLSDINIIPQFNYFQQVEILDKDKALIGHARILMITSINNGYRVYMFDIMNGAYVKDTTFFSKSRYLRGSVNDREFLATIKSATPDIKDTGYGLVFDLPVSNVKTLVNPETGKIDTTLQVVSQYFTRTTTEGKIVLSAQSGESFIAQNPLVTMGAFIDSKPALIENVSDKCIIGGSPTGAIVTIDLGKENAGRDVVLNLVCVKENATYKAKIPTSDSISFDVKSNNGKYDLRKADVYSIEQVYDADGKDVTSSFTLYSNKTISSYDVSYVISDNDNFKMPITIKFKYFQHGHGDFFCVDSYNSIKFEDIPKENGTSLGDVLDFRPRKDDSGVDYIGYGSNTSAIPQPNTVITTDISSYLPRRDKVYVSSTGEFGVVKGTPKQEPTYPNDVVDTMSLCTLDIPAYTGNIKEVALTEINNKRYTMADIGKLDSRISRTEEEIALSKLEKEVTNTQVYKDNGDAYYKNGFAVDSFTDHTNSKLDDSSYHASIGLGVLAPEIDVQNIPAKFLSGSGVSVKNGIGTLSYQETALINNSQHNTTVAIPKSNNRKWMPHLKLTPSHSPMFKGDKAMSNFSGDSVDSLPSQTWNSWGLHWIGVSPETFNDALLRTPDNATTVNGRVIDRNYTPRPHFGTIEVSVKGFKPNTRVYTLFGGINDVTEYCYTDISNTQSTQLITNNEGKLSFTVKLPETFTKTLSAGSYAIIVCDAQSLSDWSAISCFAIEYYTVVGASNIEQQRTVSTRITSPRFGAATGFNNSLAQVFEVEGDNGKFVTSVDLFFAAKDDNQPVNIELREIEADTPNNNVVSGSKVTLTSSEVFVNGTTTVTFDHPIYLQSGFKYALVVSSASDAYSAYASDTSGSISSTPHLLNLLYGNGESNWGAYENVQISMVLKRAKFDTTGTASLVLCHDDAYNILTVNTVSSTSNDNHIKLEINGGHSLMVGNIIHISGFNYEQLGFKYSNSADDFYVTEIGVDYIIVRHNSNAIGVSSQSASIPSPTGTFLGNSRADIVNIANNNLTLLGTSIDYSIVTTNSENGVPYSGTYSYKVEPNTNTVLGKEAILANTYDENVNFMGGKTFKLVHTLSSTDDSLSPVVDIQRTNIIIPYYKVGESRYSGYNQHITKVMQTTTPAEYLRAYMAIMCPSSSDVTVSCRYANSEQEILSKDWETMESSSKNVVSSIYVDRMFTKETNAFTFYQLKITINSNSKTEVPLIKRLRVIAMT